MTKIFFDTEFTGLHQHTNLISIGLITETGESFYGELTDFDVLQVDDWIQKNIIDKLTLKDWKEDDYVPYGKIVTVRGDSASIEITLGHWLHQFGKVQMWSDCLAYDWVLFCNIFGKAFDIPQNVYYIPFDISTLFLAKGIDPDISREKYAFGEVYQEMNNQKHNALWDAKVIKACYEKLIKS